MKTKNNTNRKVLIRSQILDSGTFEIDKDLNVEDEDFEEYVGQTLLLDGL